MDTSQRNAEPYISPWTEHWPRKRQLGFGFLAAIPGLLLGAAFLSWFAGAGFLPPLVYVHVGFQFITLLIFGHLLVGNPRLSGSAKLVWAVGFLFLAPFVIPLYWAIHVWEAESSLPMPSEMQRQRPEREVHVYDIDYEGSTARESERRPDGAIIHHLRPGSETP
jgi:hypothetical protein